MWQRTVKLKEQPINDDDPNQKSNRSQKIIKNFHINNLPFHETDTKGYVLVYLTKSIKSAYLCDHGHVLNTKE